MKRVILSILIILSVSLSFAQEKTTIYGKLSNCEDVKIHIKTQEFDPITMKSSNDLRGDPGKTIKAEVFADTAFYLVTEAISKPYTRCILLLGYQSKIILLSPGDSLRVDLDYWSFESGLKFEGKGSGYNRYWNELGQKYRGRRRELAIGDVVGAARIKQLTDFRNDKMRILEGYLSRADIDTAYWNWESRIIKYSYYSGLLHSSFDHRPDDSTLIAKIVEIVSDFDLNDEEALLNSFSYRSLIRSYIGFIRNPFGEKPKMSFIQLLELGEQNLKGMILSYYLWSIVSGAIESADLNVQKEIIWQYAWDHVDDHRVKNLLVQEKTVLESKSHRHGNRLPPGFYFGMAILVAIFILIWRFVIWQLRKAAKKDMKWESKHLMVLLLLIIMFAWISPVMNFVYRYELREFWPLLSALSLFAFFLAQPKLLIRYFLSKGKYYQYAIAQLLLTGAYFIALNLILRSFGDWPDVEVGGIVLKAWALSVVAMILISLVFSYIEELVEQNKDFRYLFEQIVLNAEFLIHVILLSGVYFFLGLNLDSEIGVRDMMLFFACTAVFYTTFMWLVPTYLFKKRKGMFSLFNTSLYLGFLGIIIFNEAAYNHAILKGEGIIIPIGGLLSNPGFKFFLFFIPTTIGVLYANLRRDHFNKINLNLNLYRKKEAELNQLRSQVNPHFLFNSLNTVYAFALKEKNDKTAESIAKLANLMRYLIEDMEQAEIPIRKEIGYIEDYIKLQSIRSSVKHNISVQVDLTEEQQEQMIAPMLMIPFVENAFKHGINPNNPSELKIWISYSSKGFQFRIENSIDQDFESFDKEKGFGIGIKNVRKRLELVYRGRHKLSITDAEDRYEVVMNINL